MTAALINALPSAVAMQGRVHAVRSGVIDVSGLSPRVGDHCVILSDGAELRAQVLSLGSDVAVVAVADDWQRIRVGDLVLCDEKPKTPLLNLDTHCVFDGCGEPVLPRPAAGDWGDIELVPSSVPFADRAVVSTAVPTGIAVLDDYLPLGYGQRIGVFAEAGCGKTTLLRSMANAIDADHTVMALVGERAREARELVNEIETGTRANTTTAFVGLAGDPPAVRIGALESAVATAQSLAEKGEQVLLVVDSMTRFAFALRELGLANGEPMTHSGMTPSVLRRLSEVIEMTGALRSGGSVTLVAAVLLEGPTDDAFSSYLRSLLDGHIYLTRSLADKAIFPAVDLLASRSRLDTVLLSDPQIARATEIRKALVDYQSVEEYLNFSGYERGSNASLDRKIDRFEQVVTWQQGQMATDALQVSA